MLIVDAHLDLAYNALRGRDVLRPAIEQTTDDEGIPTVGLPDLRSGDVGLVCATIFTLPSFDESPGYRTADEAHAEGMKQLDWYDAQEKAGQFRFLKKGWNEEPPKLPVGPATPVPAIILLEGADPFRTPAEVPTWFDRGVRIVGLAWKQTRYAGGTGMPGPLTPAGVELVRELDRVGMIHDTSHLAEESFWQLMDLSEGPVIASHSNCRAIVPTDRQLSDAMIRAIVERGGVIGINFFDKFLQRPHIYKTCRATLKDVVEHMKHICDLAGDAAHVAIGTDMDGGLGRDEIPKEIQTSADLYKLADAVADAGFSDQDVQQIMGLNWWHFFGKHLG